MSKVGTGERSPEDGVATASRPLLVALTVRRGGGCVAEEDVDTLGGVARGLMVGAALISADRG